MTERFEKLEAELASMQPRQIRDSVVEELGSALLDLPLQWQVRRWGDRCLVGAMSIGSLAACVIVAMLFVQSPGAPRPNGMIGQVPSAPRMGDASLALARADSPWASRLK